MRKPLHNLHAHLSPALLLALWLALAEPLTCIGYYHGHAPTAIALAPAFIHHSDTECAELGDTNSRLCALGAAIEQIIGLDSARPALAKRPSAMAEGELPANPNCFRAAGGQTHDAGAPPSPVHEQLIEARTQLQVIAWPGTFAPPPQPRHPRAGPPPPTPPPRYLAPARV